MERELLKMILRRSKGNPFHFQEDEIIDIIFTHRFSKICHCGGVFRKKKDKRQYRCSRTMKCKNHILPVKGTAFQRTPIPLRKWVYAYYILRKFKKTSSTYLAFQLNINYKTRCKIKKVLTNNELARK